MADLGRDKVCDGEAAEEDALSAEDHESHEWARFCELEEGQEVHSLVVGFFEESLDPEKGEQGGP